MYSIGTVGFICLLFLLCNYHYKLKNRNQSVFLENNFTQNNVPMSAVSSDIVAGIHETIDESNMIDVNVEVTIPITVKTTSSAESTDTFSQ